MRRVTAFLSSLALVLLLACGSAQAAPARGGPLPTTLKAKLTTEVGAPGSVVPITGRLIDAQRQPLTGAAIMIAVVEDTGHELTVQSITGTGGAFEAYAPMPDRAPASGRVEVRVTFRGTAEAAASSVTLPVRMETLEAASDAEAEVSHPQPQVTAPVPARVPSGGNGLLDQLIIAAAALFGLMLLLFGMGAVLRRRR